MVFGIFQVVLVRHLEFYDLGAGVGTALQLLQECEFLVEYLGGTGERVHGEAGLALSEVLSYLQIRINANLPHNTHGIDIQYQKMVTCEWFFLLVYKR